MPARDFVDVGARSVKVELISELKIIITIKFHLLVERHYLTVVFYEI